MFGIFSDISYFCRLLQHILEFCRTFLQTLIDYCRIYRRTLTGRMTPETVVQDCPIRNVLARVCDKWSLLVIYTLKYHQDGPLRFDALRKQIPGISQKMLTSA